jgi:hypothetical protein
MLASPGNLQCLPKKVHHTTGNIPRCTPVCNLHTASSPSYVYDYITKLCRQQAEVIRNHENDCVRMIGEGEARRGMYKWLKVGSGEDYDCSSDLDADVA